MARIRANKPAESSCARVPWGEALAGSHKGERRSWEERGARLSDGGEENRRPAGGVVCLARRSLCPMELVILCLLSWPWAPGAALPRNLGRAWSFLTEPQVDELPSPEWSGADGGSQPSPLAPGSALKAKASPVSGRKESLRTTVGDRGAGWDFSPLLVLISALALLVVSHCCFYQIGGTRLFSCVRRGWRGCLQHCRGLPRIALVSSLQHHGAFVPRAPRGLAAENRWEVRLAPSVLYSEPFVHFRRGIPGVTKDRPGPLPLAPAGDGPGCGPTSVTILEMGDEF